MGGADIGGQVIHHHVNAELPRIALSQSLETRHNIFRRLALTDTADQAVGVDIIEAVQLFNAALPSISGALTLWMSMACPAPARDRPEFQRPELIVTHDHAVLGSLGVQGQNALFFA